MMKAGTITINCADYIAIYDSLNRYRNSDNAMVRDYAERIEDEGVSIYDICDSEAPNQTDYSFSGDNINDLNRWRRNFNAIEDDMTLDLVPLTGE